MKYLRAFTVIPIIVLFLGWLNPEWQFTNLIPSDNNSFQYNVFALLIIGIYAYLIILLLIRENYHKRESWTVFSVLVRAIVIVALFFVIKSLCGFTTELFYSLFSSASQPDEIKNLYILAGIFTAIVVIVKVLLK